MITSEQFSKNLLFVFLSLLGLGLLTVFVTYLSKLLPFEYYLPYAYVIGMMPDLIFGIILSTRKKFGPLAAFSIILLSLSFPVFAAIFYLFLLLSLHDESQAKTNY